MYLGDRYEILSKVGEGTYGEVYKVHDLTKNLIVAVKRFKQATNDPQDGVSMQCLREISLSIELRHENIVNIYKIIDIQREIYMFMEYCDTDLGKILTISS